MWSDYCKLLNHKFALLHIVLRGEYRTLSKHDEYDLKEHLPFECPFFNKKRSYWEMYGRIQMNVEVFIFECENHFQDYKGWYVYSLKDNIDYIKSELPPQLDLNYITVSSADELWFINSFGEKVVLLSNEPPDSWVYPVPPEPV